MTWFKVLKSAIMQYANYSYIVLLMASTLWHIWLAHNELRFNHSWHFPKVETIITRILQFVLDMEKGHPLTLNNHVIKILREIWIKWSPPQPGKFKMNIDGASFGNPGPCGLGCVLRNNLAVFN
ncbi:hypothetical protein FRX31_018858 [Thalictrum thalictroides]|uniref:Uncharacterized protein n=1 Tax=Thalictrum thalictroides TaxID=46969 RepID=A0A7J6W3N4_THATH|nr:hypothetical protein FRX31_018858 [Thalictrum thalictroides]